MVVCKAAASCPFFSGKAPVSEWLRYQYCHGNFAQCARHTVHESLGSEFVPADLFPNEQVRAHQILSRANLSRGSIRPVAAQRWQRNG